MAKGVRLILAVAVLALGAIVGLPSADAGTCAANTKCFFDLTVANVSQLNPPAGSIDLKVTWDNTVSGGTGTTLSVQFVSSTAGTPKFIEEFGYNSSVAVTSVSDGTANSSKWSGTSNANIDGFGTFATDESRAVLGDTFGITSAIVFTLASQITSIPLNSTNTEFVAHVGGFDSGCSAFVGEGGSTVTPGSNTSCAAVPEPITMFLGGTGLITLGYAARKRLFGGRRLASVS